MKRSIGLARAASPAGIKGRETGLNDHHVSVGFFFCAAREGSRAINRLAAIRMNQPSRNLLSLEGIMTLNLKPARPLFQSDNVSFGTYRALNRYGDYSIPAFLLKQDHPIESLLLVAYWVNDGNGFS